MRDLREAGTYLVVLGLVLPLPRRTPWWRDVREALGYALVTVLVCALAVVLAGCASPVVADEATTINQDEPAPAYALASRRAGQRWRLGSLYETYRLCEASRLSAEAWDEINEITGREHICWRVGPTGPYIGGDTALSQRVNGTRYKEVYRNDFTPTPPTAQPRTTIFGLSPTAAVLIATALLLVAILAIVAMTRVSEPESGR